MKTNILKKGEYVKLSNLDSQYIYFAALSKGIFRIADFLPKDGIIIHDCYKLEYYSGEVEVEKFLTDTLSYPDPPISRNYKIPTFMVFQDEECLRISRKDKLNRISNYEN